jgi:7-carboxy-7-deazaguanine synthase
MIRINEIFKSIDGEGIRTGQPTIFIRFAGCNLRCDYCDTDYALKASQYDDRYTDIANVMCDVLQYCIPDNINNITITGGEPLLQKESIISILDTLSSFNHFMFSVNIETNGSINPNEFIELYNKSEFCKNPENSLFFTFDLKTSSAGEDAKNACCDDSNLPKFWNHKIVNNSKSCSTIIKSVVGSIEDLEYVRTMYNKSENIYHTGKYIWYVSPVFDKIEPCQIVEYVLKYPECNSWIVQVQLHKIIWDKNKRGV